MVAKQTFSYSADTEVNDPIQALTIQLELLESRINSTRTALKKGHKRDMLEHIKRVREIAIRISNLAFVYEPYVDKSLVTKLRECAQDSGAHVTSDISDGILAIDGNFNILKLVRRFLW